MKWSVKQMATVQGTSTLVLFWPVLIVCWPSNHPALLLKRAYTHHVYGTNTILNRVAFSSSYWNISPIYDRTYRERAQSIKRKQSLSYSWLIFGYHFVTVGSLWDFCAYRSVTVKGNICTSFFSNRLFRFQVANRSIYDQSNCLNQYISRYWFKTADEIWTF